MFKFSGRLVKVKEYFKKIHYNFHIKPETSIAVFVFDSRTHVSVRHLETEIDERLADWYDKQYHSSIEFGITPEILNGSLHVLNEGRIALCITYSS